jgi:hypothetical protein
MDCDCDIDEFTAKLSEMVKNDPDVLCDFPIGMPNFKIPTLGGVLFWEDVGTIKGWRMQRNILTRHWRILDSNNVRHAWGMNKKMVDIFTRVAVTEIDAEAEEEVEEDAEAEEYEQEETDAAETLVAESS